MSKVAEKLAQMGLVLPAALQVPAGVVLPFPWVNVRGETVYVSGHGPQNEDGSLAGPFGQVGGEVPDSLPSPTSDIFRCRSSRSIATGRPRRPSGSSRSTLEPVVR